MDAESERLLYSQIGPVLLIAEITGLLFTVTVTEAQVPGVTHPPVPRTKYVVVDAGETEIEVPVPAEAPPQEPLYQDHVVASLSEPDTILNTLAPPLQIVPKEDVATGTLGAAQLATPDKEKLYGLVPQVLLAKDIVAVKVPVTDGAIETVNALLSPAAIDVAGVAVTLYAEEPETETIGLPDKFSVPVPVL